MARAAAAVPALQAVMLQDKQELLDKEIRELLEDFHRAVEVAAAPEEQAMADHLMRAMEV